MGDGISPAAHSRIWGVETLRSNCRTFPACDGEFGRSAGSADACATRTKTPAAAGVFVLVAQASAEPADRPNSPSHAGNVRQFDLRVSTPQMREWAAGEIPSPILVFRNIVFLAFKKYRLN